MEVRRICDLRPNSYNGTLWVDSLSDTAGLAESILQEGVRAPLIVTPSGMILDGERRWRACQSIGILEVPVQVDDRDLTEEELGRLVRGYGAATRAMTVREQAFLYRDLVQDYLGQYGLKSGKKRKPKTDQSEQNLCVDSTHRFSDTAELTAEELSRRTALRIFGAEKVAATESEQNLWSDSDHRFSDQSEQTADQGGSATPEQNLCVDSTHRFSDQGAEGYSWPPLRAQDCYEQARKVARFTSVSVAQRALAVFTQGTPQVQQQVLDGEMSLDRAYGVVKGLTRKPRPEVVAKPAALEAAVQAPDVTVEASELPLKASLPSTDNQAVAGNSEATGLDIEPTGLDTAPESLPEPEVVNLADLMAALTGEGDDAPEESAAFKAVDNSQAYGSYPAWGNLPTEPAEGQVGRWRRDGWELPDPLQLAGQLLTRWFIGEVKQYGMDAAREKLTPIIKECLAAGKEAAD